MGKSTNHQLQSRVAVHLHKTLQILGGLTKLFQGTTIALLQGVQSIGIEMLKAPGAWEGGWKSYVRKFGNNT